ncbi:MAG: hypothetical protein KME10_22410 [Plectolyngbya sp. WJT66-NPBG17]|nr:hypothetical protein [Plectolyngbya sp. WJT66-NPBG17]MBW4525546.1 hypothetical protein [Phormidium tanganyikae FI6-MK23]
MANTNPGDQHDRTNYAGSTPDPANLSSENSFVEPSPEVSGSGYTQGRAVERQRYETTQQVRDENNTANGFLIGILLTGLVLGGAALAYFVTQRDRTPTIQRTIVVPSASPSPSPSPEVRERVIERDRIVPVPQPQQSSPTVIPAPTIKIEAPKPSPVAPAPQVSPATPSNSQTKPATEQPKSAEPSPSPEATTSPTPSNQ